MPRLLAIMAGVAMLITFGSVGLATATIYELLDATPSLGCTETTCGIQWVVQDVHPGHNLIIGTGFFPNHTNYISHATIADPYDWDPADAAWVVGEAIYIALTPSELSVVHPGMRRVFMATENDGHFGYFDPTPGTGLQPWVRHRRETPAGRVLVTGRI